jgi:hypothetical protein
MRGDELEANRHSRVAEAAGQCDGWASRGVEGAGVSLQLGNQVGLLAERSYRRQS